MSHFLDVISAIQLESNEIACKICLFANASVNYDIFSSLFSAECKMLQPNNIKLILMINFSVGVAPVIRIRKAFSHSAVYIYKVKQSNHKQFTQLKHTHTHTPAEVSLNEYYGGDGILNTSLSYSKHKHAHQSLSPKNTGIHIVFIFR